MPLPANAWMVNANHKLIETNKLAAANSWPGHEVASSRIVLSSSSGVK